MTFFLPLPPNPEESQYASPLAYKRALYDWAVQTKGRLEQSAVLSNGIAVMGAAIGQIPVRGSNAWLPGYIGTGLAAGNGISISGTGTSTIGINLAAGTNISITGTATQTIALASNVTNSFPARTPIAGTSYSILSTDYLIAYTTLGSAVTATLPSAIGRARQGFIVKDEFGSAGTNAITIATGTVSQTIDGTSAKAINTNYGNLRLYSNGSNYFTW